MKDGTLKQINIYISSASTSEDQTLLDELEKQLSVLKRQPKLSLWQKRLISPGTHREQEISAYLCQAHLILFLMSPDFLASDQCYEEMKLAMAKMNAKEVSVIPLLLCHTAGWQDTPIGMLEPLPSDRKTVSDRADRERTMCDIAEHIRHAVEQIRQNLPDKSPQRPFTDIGYINALPTCNNPRVTCSWVSRDPYLVQMTHILTYQST